MRYLIVLLLCCISCTQYKKEFIQVVSDHRAVTVETVDSLIVSIESDMKSRIMSEAETQSVKNLIDRLKFMKEGSIVIEKYVMNQADLETLSKVLHAKYQTP